METQTVHNLWTLCKREHWNRGTQWDREVERLYNAHIQPEIGALNVQALRYADIIKLRTKLASTPNQANRVISVLSKMLNLAECFEWRPIGSNPCQRIPRFRERSRSRAATPEEIARLGPIMEAEAKANPAAIAFLYLLLFSGARPSEIARATWDQITEGAIRLPEGKTGQRKVFLPPQALRILERLPKRQGGTITGLSGVPRRIWGRIRAAAGCPDLYARDFRRTFATIGLSNGVPIGMIGELLGHKSAQTTKVYAKLMEGPAVSATDEIANRIERMLSGILAG